MSSSKLVWKPGTMLYPVPSVIVSCRDESFDNLITISWVGTICSDPPMLSISVRPERLSYDIIKKTGEFVVNIPDSAMLYAVDYCGVSSGRDVDKFSVLKLTKAQAEKVNCPLIEEAPISIECVVKKTIPLGSHDMFLSEVVAVNVRRSLVDRTGRLALDKADLICYNHGTYCVAMKHAGKFGFSIEKKKKTKSKR